MCRRLLLLLALCALVGFATHASARTFSDVSGTDYEQAFAYLSEKNVVHGYADGLARPGWYLNRAEALKVIIAVQKRYVDRVAKLEDNMPPLPLFSDIRQDQWFSPYVEVAFENGIITGYPDGTLRPAQLLRVEEAVAILMRSFGENGSEGAAELSEYIENKEGEWFTPYVNAAVTRNLVMNKRPGLRLGTAITRGQFFDMVYRLHKVRVDGSIAYSGPEPKQAQPVHAQGVNITTPVQDGQTISVGQSTPSATISVAQAEHSSEKPFAISMPGLGIEDLAVVHPEDPFSSEGVLAPLKHGVGHLFSYPGGGGKIMVYGHSSGYPWDVSQYTKIFRKINELKTGDRVYVTYDGKLYTYEVTREQTVDASDTQPFQDNGTGEELILYTCWPPDSISQRYLVHARPVNTVAVR